LDRCCGSIGTSRLTREVAEVPVRAVEQTECLPLAGGIGPPAQAWPAGRLPARSLVCRCWRYPKSARRRPRCCGDLLRGAGRVQTARSSGSKRSRSRMPFYSRSQASGARRRTKIRRINKEISDVVHRNFTSMSIVSLGFSSISQCPVFFRITTVTLLATSLASRPNPSPRDFSPPITSTGMVSLV
jgi:hypothetical protein